MIAWAVFAYINAALAVIALLWAGVQLVRAYQWLAAHDAQQRRQRAFDLNLNAASRCQ